MYENKRSGDIMMRLLKNKESEARHISTYCTNQKLRLRGDSFKNDEMRKDISKSGDEISERTIQQPNSSPFEIL